MSRILVIEDEQDLGTLLEYNLRADGHEAEVVRTGAGGVSKAKSWKPDLILLDLMLPDIAGGEVARLLREGEPKRIPIIMVTARGEEGDRVKGLELGADDYVVKPFSVKELLLRVKAVLRRHSDEPRGDKSDATKLTKGAIQLDVDRHEVRVSDKAVVLTALEFRLLKTFLERPGRVQTRETLLSDVWGIDADITTRTVDTHIKRLREKLGPAGDVIETIRGVGYKLTS
jgi:two-component system, OmpR family, phosphate regulon response regulator PhoB